MNRMSESFFGFDTGAPVLGGGKEEPGLIDTLEDDIDLMNDETFGDAATTDDWEYEHEKLAADNAGADLLNGSYQAGLVQGLCERHSPQSREHDLEASLRKLVKDDEEDYPRGRAIPQRTSHLSELFGPSCPSGLFDTEELVRGRENIWGSPVRDSPLARGAPHPSQLSRSHGASNAPPPFLQQQQQQHPGEDGLKSLLQQLHQAPPFQQEPSRSLSSSLPTNNAPARSLHDIEQEMLTQRAPPPPRSRAMTVEELERELVGESPRRGSTDRGAPPPGQPQLGQVHILRRASSPNQQLPLPIGTPPRQSLLQHPPSSQPLPLPGFSPRVPPPGWTPGGASPAQGHLSDRPRRTSPPAMPPGLTGRIDSPNFRHHHPELASYKKSIESVMLDVARYYFADHMASLSPSALKPSDLHALNYDIIRAYLIQEAEAGRRLPDGRRSSDSPPYQQRMPPPMPHGEYHHRHHQSDIRQQLFQKSQPRAPGFHQGPPPHMQRGRGLLQMEHRGGVGRGIGRGQYPGYPHRQQHFHHRDDHHGDNYHNNMEDEEEEENRNADPYANLMTDREKDWVIKIQLRQLQTENPYLDDYYYTSMQMKKEALENQKQHRSGSDAKLVIPQIVAKVDSKAYKPLTFEGSLGRLTTSSVHNPRRIIDVSSNTLHENDEAKGREVRRFKKLLLDIEASYDTLLDVDELEKRALALPDEARAAVYEERHQKILHLYEAFNNLSHDEEAFCRLLAIRKGVKVVARLLPLLPKNEGQIMASTVLSYLAVMSKKEWQKDVLPVVFENLQILIHSSSLEGLVMCSKSLLCSHNSASELPHTEIIANALQNQFGSSVIWCMISRGETLYASVSPVDMEIEHQNAWSGFVRLVTEAVEAMSKDTLAKPSGMAYANVGRHLERLVDKRALRSVEDKLQALLMTDAPQRAT